MFYRIDIDSISAPACFVLKDLPNGTLNSAWMLMISGPCAFMFRVIKKSEGPVLHLVEPFPTLPGKGETFMIVNTSPFATSLLNSREGVKPNESSK